MPMLKVWLLPKMNFEKQGEQKPTNKIEPKFKVGDWIVSNEKLYVYQIEEINKFVAKVRNINGETFVVNVNCLNDAHLWTIRDAKDGDVVSNGKMIVIFKHFEEPSYRQHIVAYIGLDTNGDIQITDDTWNLGIDKTKPATKEQRDTLIKAMTDAGYAFDFEKKELKKIEQNIEMVEALRTEYEKGRADAFAQTQKEWSDEDEKIVSEVIQNYESGFLPSVIERDRIVKTLKSLKDRVQPQPKQEWSEEDEKMFEYALDMIEWYSGKNENKSRAVSNWLKSLKDRVQPQNWTKEDKERYISCLKRLSTGNPEQPETINSKWFKEHVYPQTTWKPSDEQLEAVKRASNGSRAIAGNDYLIMESLYNNLKKLKGE